MQKYETTSLIHWKSCFGKDKIFHRKKNAFYEHAICLELCFNVLINILKFSTLISNTVSISYNPHEWHLSGSSKYFSNVRRSRDQIFKKLLLNEDPTQPKIIFFKLQKKKNCCWKWKGCVSLICDIINFVFIRIPYFSTHFYVIQRSWLDCIQCFYLTSKLPLPRKKHWKGPVLWQPCVQVFPAHLNIKCVSNFSCQPQKCSLYFKIFCVQMHLPTWFSHRQIITKHPPIVL